MYYFDRLYLQQYLKTGKPLQVYTDREYLTISDIADLLPRKGIGYRVTGEAVYFDYRDITQVKLGDVIYSAEQLNKSMTPDSPPEEDTKKNDQEKQPKDAKPSDKDFEEPEEKKEHIVVGGFVINDDKTSKYYATRGVVESITENLIFYRTFYKNKYQVVSCWKNKIK